MASNSKRLKLCSHNEDRISGLPGAVLCHILSFLSTREAVKTSVLSHRWKNVWASVPILDFDEEEYYLEYVFRTLSRPIGYDPDWFAQFVNRVLLFRCPGDIHRFRLVATRMHDVSLIYAWISTAIRRNVVELDLRVGTSTDPHFEIPKRLFMCSTLVKLKLWLRRDISVITPRSNCFPCLKFLHVTLLYPDSDSMEKLFSRFPVLEDLIIDGNLEDASAFKLDISAPKLKRLQIRLTVHKFAMGSNNFVNYVCQIFINADAPDLEELDICSDVLVSFSLKNANCLSKAEVDFSDVKELEDHDCFLGLVDRIRQIFAGICDAKYLTVKAPILTALDIGNQRLLPTLNNLSHLELQLETCRCLQSLTTWLKISPNLEHLKISTNREHLWFADDYKYCDDDNEDILVHEWGAPEFANICLVSHLKTVCLWDFKGCPNDMEVAKYLVKHGKALNKVTIYTHFSEDKEMEIQSPITLWSKFSKFLRGSKTCKIQFKTIVSDSSLGI
ncbi:F-box/FBD/LRR-repeat protein At1g16930-like [Rosa rugosa]|uniref:F-box/FBD/LRR-repeat protein At1g16930-like n=1 Tax=Rosa rugosa TaxID=74645 RepID=UPI002B408089|nr:F-box/FBD/LRR-repeat protein At1g16930-like [Rosa rugosa]XP_061988357.1 F-box/FBD/LRR-repeat protein At1g16930-like [Rosa rugosa]XP_061988358.1 F-box/FBD/LRR-repeat protein At1g16930-like [Rosa rugosa]